MGQTLELKPGFSLASPFFWVFLATIFSVLSTVALIAGFPIILPVVITVIIAGTVLLFDAPLLLLFGLILIRMSLDYTAQFYSFSLQSITLSLSQLLGIGIALLGLLVIIKHIRELRRFPLVLPFLILLAWGAATLSYSIAPRTGLQELVRIFDLFTLSFLAFIAVRTKHDFRKLFFVILLSGILPVLFAFIQLALGIGFSDPNVSTPRIFGTFSHPNVFSLYLFVITTINFIVLYRFDLTPIKKFFFLVSFFLFTLTLFLTFSRVAWVALFLFIFVLGVWRYRLLLIPLFLLPLMLFLLSSDFQERILDSFQSDPDSSILWRQNLWSDMTTQAFSDGRQWVGTGIDTFPLVSESLRGIRLGSNDAHNDFVKFFIDGGFIGLSVFLVFLLGIFSVIVRNIRSCKDLENRELFIFLGIVFVILETSALTDNIFKNTPVQWLFFIALGGLLALQKKRSE